MLQTPVAFFIFNRPDTTEMVFAEIAKAKPSKLLVVADGPRVGRLDDEKKCAATRSLINRVDWDCEVLTNYSDINLGCKRRVSSGLDWVFEICEEAIILEDDCLPHPTFFQFCEELLSKYNDDERVMAISGNNFLYGEMATRDSYYFSYFPHCWGWATWRRAWKHFDADACAWPEVSEGLPSHFGDEATARYFRQTIEQEIINSENTTWDLFWCISCWAQHGISILPGVNLVSNIGFGAASTHTSNPNKLSNLPTAPISFPLQHPKYMIRDAGADKYSFERVCLWYGEDPSLYDRLHRMFYRYVPSPLRQLVSILKGLKR